MMKNVTNKMMEFEGKTLEDATHSASDYFGVEESFLDIQVLSKASTGIFGLGVKKCRILATLKPEKLSEIEINDNKSKQPGADQPEVLPQAATIQNNETENRKEKEIAYDKIVKTEKAKQDDFSLTNDNIPDEKGMEEELVDLVEDYDEDAGLEQLSEEEIVDYITQMKGYVDKILELAGLDVVAAIKHDEKGGFIDISGNDIHLVIGRDGSNLDAIYYLINRIVRNKSRKNLTIRVDADGYNRKHEMRLIENAERLAQRAKQTGKNMILSPLSPRDRRFIHMHLKIVGGVRTTSIGEGIYKKIMIVPHKPKKKPDGKQNERERGFRQPSDNQNRPTFPIDNRDSNDQRPQRSPRYNRPS
jgi:spoIIIJ-associated protein